ncbi:MAG: hypothetical protein CBB60_008545 [Armatimonadetes bacterium Cent15-Ar3]|jgi:hypothetical protein|nr:MAG: hypothetical protein CBB60_008545 [Armatimonadetes bacterium Cent15-Ar3]
MVTIGDSFSIVATLAGVALTIWSFMLVCALLFPVRVEEARQAVSGSLGKCFGAGLVAFMIGVIGFVVVQLPNPLLKLVGMLIMSGYLGCVMVGASGVAKLAAQRIQDLTNQQESQFASYGKASWYLVVAGLLPVLGWFLFAPLMMVVGGGAGLKAALKSQTVNEVA